MNMNIEFAENGIVVINGKIFAEGTMDAFELRALVEEYEKLGFIANVYTPKAMEVEFELPEALTNHFKRMDYGTTMGYNNDTIEKVSPHFCMIKGEKIVQLSEPLKKAV